MSRVPLRATRPPDRATVPGRCPRGPGSPGSCRPAVPGGGRPAYSPHQNSGNPGLQRLARATVTQSMVTENRRGAGCTPTPRDADTCPWNAFCCSQVSTSRRNGAVHARLPRDSCERRVWRLRDAALPSERALAAAGRLPARARRPMSLAGHPVTGRWPPRAQEVAVSALRTREPVTALRRGWPTSPAPQLRAVFLLHHVSPW